MFAKPNDPDLIAYCGYDQADSQYGRCEDDHQDVINIVDVGTIQQIMKGVGLVDRLVVINDVIFMIMVATPTVSASGCIIRSTLKYISQNQTNLLEGMV